LRRVWRRGMSYGRRVRVGARVRVGVQGVDGCLRPGRWCVKYRQARGRLGIRAGAVAVAVAVAVAAAAVTYESPSVACDAHTLPRLSRMCARCESRRAGQGEGGGYVPLRPVLVGAVGMESGQKVGKSMGSGQECVANPHRARCGTRSVGGGGWGWGAGWGWGGGWGGPMPAGWVAAW